MIRLDCMCRPSTGSWLLLVAQEMEKPAPVNLPGCLLAHCNPMKFQKLTPVAGARGGQYPLALVANNAAN